MSFIGVNEYNQTLFNYELISLCFNIDQFLFLILIEKLSVSRNAFFNYCRVKDVNKMIRYSQSS